MPRKAPNWRYWLRHPLRGLKAMYPEEGAWLVVVVPVLPFLLLYIGPFVVFAWFFGVTLRLAKVGQDSGLRGILMMVAVAMPVLFWIGVLELVARLTGWPISLGEWG